MRRNDYLCLFSVLTLTVFVVLFLLRAADDNRLTSWQWVFTQASAGRVLLITAAGLIISYFFVSTALSLRYPALVLFCTAFGISAFFWSEPEVIIDASRYFTQAKHLEQFGIRFFIQEWGRSIASWTDLPLIPFIYGVILSLSDESRLAVQIFTSMTYSMTTVVVYLLGKDLWDEETGFIAGILLMGIPYLLTQAPLFLVDVPAMFYFTLALFSFQRAVWRGGYGFILFSSAAVTAAFFSKYSLWPALFLFPVVVLLPFIASPKRPAGLREIDGSRSRGGERAGSAPILPVCLRRCIGISVCSALMIAVIVIPKYEVFIEQVVLLIGYQKPGLRRWGESFVSTFIFQVHPFLTTAALCSFWIAFKRRDARYVMVSIFVIIVVLFQVKRIRYIIPIFPMLSLMAAYGFGGIRDREVKHFLVLCVLVSSLAISLFAYLPFTRTISTINLKNAGELLDARKIDKAEVYVLPQKNAPLNPAVSVPILDFFTKAKLLFMYHPEDFTPEGPVEESALRFTWEYKNPVYYETKEKFMDGSSALVIVTDEKDYQLQTHLEQRTKKLQLLAFFDSYEKAFQFRTFVAVYGPLNENHDSLHKRPGS